MILTGIAYLIMASNSHSCAEPPDAGVRVYNIQSGDEISAHERIRQGLPSIKDREEMFGIAGLTENLVGMDEVNRDLFYLSASQLQLQSFLKKYPKLPPQKLKKFHRLVAKRGDA